MEKEFEITDLNMKIEEMREKLNELMAHNYIENYEEVLQVSTKLDKLIYNYCKLEFNYLIENNQ